MGKVKRRKTRKVVSMAQSSRSRRMQELMQRTSDIHPLHLSLVIFGFFFFLLVVIYWMGTYTTAEFFLCGPILLQSVSEYITFARTRTRSRKCSRTPAVLVTRHRELQQTPFEG